MGSALHKMYGGLRMVQVCRDWPRWFREYFAAARDNQASAYRMRNGCTFRTRRNGNDLHIIDEVWAFRKYDYYGFRVRPGDVVVDVGGNIGVFSAYAASVCGAKRVIAFEPEPENFDLLCKNVEENGLGQVTCVNKAVSAHNGTARLEVSPVNPGAHRLVAEAGRGIDVACCTLEQVCQDFGLDRIDYLKMDCEGAEYDIFSSISPELFNRIGRISMEYHYMGPHGPEELSRRLSENGFKVIDFDRHRLYAERAN